MGVEAVPTTVKFNCFLRCSGLPDYQVLAGPAMSCHVSKVSSGNHDDIEEQWPRRVQTHCSHWSHWSLTSITDHSWPVPISED